MELIVEHEYKQTELGYIPADWYVKKLLQVCSMKSGSTITAKNIDESGKYPVYGGNGLRGYTNTYTHNGTYAIVGRQGALCGNVTLVDGEFFASEHAVVVTPKTSTDIVWLSYMLNRMNLNQYSESTAQPGLSVQKIIDLPIVTPSSIQEETAIAIALRDTDVLITGLEELIAKKRNLKQGAIQELLRPKKDWVVKKLGEVCKVFGRIGFRGYTVNDIVKQGEGAITISPSNIQGGKMDLSKCTYISWFKYEESPEIKIFPRDILLVKTGSTFGKTALVKDLPEKATVNPQIVVLKNITVDNVFLAYVMGYVDVQNQIDTSIVGGAIPTLSQQQVMNFDVHIPNSMSEQGEIAATLSDIDNEIESLERKLEKYKDIKQGMVQVLLTGKVRLM